MENQNITIKKVSNDQELTVEMQNFYDQTVAAKESSLAKGLKEIIQNK